ncbi:hypothetical protein Tco_0947356 [Tanacetum coccineum]
MVQSEDAPRQTPWTMQEEIALCKGWLAVSENSKQGNSRKTSGFWCDVLSYENVRTALAFLEIIMREVDIVRERERYRDDDDEIGVGVSLEEEVNALDDVDSDAELLDCN